MRNRIANKKEIVLSLEGRFLILLQETKARVCVGGYCEEGWGGEEGNKGQVHERVPITQIWAVKYYFNPTQKNCKIRMYLARHRWGSCWTAQLFWKRMWVRRLMSVKVLRVLQRQASPVRPRPVSKESLTENRRERRLTLWYRFWTKTWKLSSLQRRWTQEWMKR